ncbi:MAG: hypothetical protein WCW66_01500 [Patescibacteria group bacterium]
MPGEPRLDISNPRVDIHEVSDKLNEITDRWAIEDPLQRNEPELRRLEAALVPQLEQVLEADISAELNPELVEAVNGAYGMFDDEGVTSLLLRIKDKLEAKDPYRDATKEWME